MFKKIFSDTSQEVKEVACEVTGKKATLRDTVSLVRINEIIVLKNLQNTEIDYSSNTIYSEISSPLKYYREILVPNDLQLLCGRLFAVVEDEDEVETSTAIISEEGMKSFTGSSLMPLSKYFAESGLLQIPNSMFFVIISKKENLLKQTCEIWKEEFSGIRRKYMAKKILDTRKESQQFGRPGVMLPGWDVGISDVSRSNPQGHGYLFKTDKQYSPINLCSNESAVQYCKKNNVLIYYNDFLNKGKLRLLSEHTPKINEKLQNPYIYRSSNI